ncbi:MAG: S-methyl-5-thioribose-1-phosphate isomerase [Thaumarchaeota archaeon]|nr:S-methyl-5-thioribose-1-phosphate isomerase [Nitrososphaerota archaeon]MDG7042615.1 S-methyl-5-thioribose-1-phosphate isomerase [Nitrososphaerota archaeon]
MRPIRIEGDSIAVLDQRLLPTREVWIKVRSVDDAFSAIRELKVRGAPLIGVVGAYGLAQNITGNSQDDRLNAEKLKGARPTAINLAWAIDRVLRASLGGSRGAALQEAKNIFDEELNNARLIGVNGEPLISEGDAVLTHCNAGALATVDYGTALAPLRIAKDKGKKFRVFATETRPVMQGSRLTAYELLKDGFDVTLIADTAVGYTMSRGMIKKVIVGADRVFNDGHTINKIGTFQVATLAKRFGIPFYVALPLSTLDLEGNEATTKIEERGSVELEYIRGKRVAPRGIRTFNPAFDITPPDLITTFITEKGVLKPPFKAINKIGTSS